MHPITVLSFGYLHPWPKDEPNADIVLDLRRLLADPAHRPEGNMLDMTGLDPRVENFVFATPGAYLLVHTAFNLAVTAAQLKPVTVAFGCAGGRHRSVACAEKVAWLLQGAGQKTTPRHLHVHLPRVIHQA